jgi:hypothetical protein
VLEFLFTERKFKVDNIDINEEGITFTVNDEEIFIAQ